MSTDRIICVVGPTASGKTKLSVALAQRLNGEVLSCDSMQLYRGMDIGTAKPTAAEQAGIPHHMIDCIDPNDDFSVGRYVTEADAILQDILRRGKTAVIVGGTGLYVDSLIAGRSFAEAPSTGKREELKRYAEEHGIAAVLEQLREIDPERAAKLQPADEKRILRAMEIWLETGKTATEHDLETQQQPAKYHPVWLGLNFRDRQDLYDRINRRVEQMIADGLPDELERLLASGIRPDCTAMQAIGYKELLRVRSGELSPEQGIADLQQGTRRYAKRQLSWFRRNPELHWLLLDRDPDFDELVSRALSVLTEAGFPF